jgi:XXXCH domain-containing protein
VTRGSNSLTFKGARKVDAPLKTLKKRMSKSFKDLLKAMDDGRLPEFNLVASWCEDADLMVTLQDPGKEHFHSFQVKCHELLESVEQRQRESAKAAGADLNRMRKECHSCYK